jgi:hypothetical protein
MNKLEIVIKKYITSKPFLYRTLRLGLINISALAREVKPIVDYELRYNIKLSTIMSLLRKYVESGLYQNSLDSINGFCIDSITVYSELTDFAFNNGASLFEKQIELLQSLKNYDNAFYVSSMGREGFNLIIESKYENLVRSIFNEEKSYFRKPKLAAITLKFYRNTKTPSLIYHYVFQRVMCEKIPVIEVVNTSNEITLVINEYSLENAFKLFRNIRDYLVINLV